LKAWTVGLCEKGWKVAVFPTPSGKGVVIDPMRLADDLAIELRQYE
jgi:hypothetical protein